MKNQTCRFCEDPDSILTRETCCSCCSKIDNPYPIIMERQWISKDEAKKLWPDKNEGDDE